MSASLASESGATLQMASTARCAWKPLCGRGAGRAAGGCARKAGVDYAGRVAAAPSFERGSGTCFAGERALLSRAWASHPQGGRVLPGRAFGRLVHV